MIQQNLIVPETHQKKTISFFMIVYSPNSWYENIQNLAEVYFETL